MKLFVTGGTGFIGSALVRARIAEGDEVVVLTRDASRHTDGSAALRYVEGDPQYAGAWQDAVGGCDAVVHLAGASIAGKRWDARYKQLLRDSRVHSAERLVEAMAAAPKPPAVLLTASGIDFYPFAEDLDAHTARFEDDPVAEDTPPGSSFLARLCVQWEAEAARARSLGARVVALRTGLVIGPGGALDRMATPFKFFAGGRIGSGQQWTSWVDVRDVIRAYGFVLAHDTLDGPVNLVSPDNARNHQLSAAIGKALGRPSWMPVPGVALKAVVGEFSEYILHGRRAVPRALEAAGFGFEHANLEASVANALSGE